MTVLECGCGAGRFTEVLLAEGARVVSVNLSDAVEANAQTCAIDPRHRVAQADIVRLPFGKEQFDLVLCLGVIQHTPSPELTIEALANQVRPGGWLVLDHYTYELSRLKTAALFRQVLRRLPPEAGLRATEWLVDALLPLHKRARRVPLVQPLLSRISPVALLLPIPARAVG